MPRFRASLFAPLFPGRQPEFLVTHPYPEHRMEAIDATLKQRYPDGIPSNLMRGARLRHGLPVGETGNGNAPPSDDSERDTWPAPRKQ